jgi:hypothetical protein
MKLRFIEYKSDIYVVIGITYDSRYLYPECFVAVPLDDVNPSIFRAILDLSTINIPFVEAKEITSKNKLISLMVLYG